MKSTPNIILTGNLVYIKPLADAVLRAGLSPREIDIMKLRNIAGPDDLTEALNTYKIENMVYSRPEHVEMFLKLMNDTNKPLLTESVIHFVQDARSFKLLNDQGLPVLQSPGDRSIDMVEYFLRLNRTGPVLTPCVDPEAEEIPEFLAELKFESRYFRMYEAAPFSKDELETIREEFYGTEKDSDYVLLHEPGTITQFLVAFPDSDLSSFTYIPLHKKTEEKLRHLGLKHTEVIPYHPDQAARFSEALKEKISQ